MPPKALKKNLYVVDTFGIDLDSGDFYWHMDGRENPSRTYALEECVLRLHRELVQSRDDVQTLIKARDRATAERRRREALEARTPEEKAQAKDQAAAKVLENLRNSNTMLRKQNVEMRAEMARVRETARIEKQALETERRSMLALPRNAKAALAALQRIMDGVPDAVAVERPQEGRTWEMASGLGEALAGGSSLAVPKTTITGPRHNDLEID